MTNARSQFFKLKKAVLNGHTTADKTATLDHDIDGIAIKIQDTA